jgi:hypothetical protein
VVKKKKKMASGYDLSAIAKKLLILAAFALLVFSLPGNTKNGKKELPFLFSFFLFFFFPFFFSLLQS